MIPKMHNIVQTSMLCVFTFCRLPLELLTASVTDAAALTTNSVADSCIKPLQSPRHCVHNRRVNAQRKVIQSILIHILQQSKIVSDCWPNTDWLESFSRYPRLNLLCFSIFKIKEYKLNNNHGITNSENNDKKHICHVPSKQSKYGHYNTVDSCGLTKGFASLATISF